MQAEHSIFLVAFFVCRKASRSVYHHVSCASELYCMAAEEAEKGQGRKCRKKEFLQGILRIWKYPLYYFKDKKKKAGNLNPEVRKRNLSVGVVFR